MSPLSAAAARLLTAALVFLAASPAAEAAPRPPRWLYVGVHAPDGDVPQEMLEELEWRLDQALRRSGVARIGTRIVVSGGGVEEVEAALAEADRLLDAGLARYLDMRMAAASRKLEKAWEVYDGLLPQAASPEPFVRCSLYLAMSYLAEGKKRLGRRILRRLLVRFSDADLPLSEFPPQLQEEVERLQARTRASAALTLTTRPAGAVVFLNGRLVGRTPLRDRPIVPGQHALRLEAPGHVPAAEVLEVDAASAGAVRDLVLRPDPADGGALALIRARYVDVSGGALRTAAAHLARKADVTAVVVGWLARGPADRLVLAAGRFDAALGTYTAIAVAPAAPGELEGAVDEVAGLLVVRRPPPASEAARRTFFGVTAAERREAAAPLGMSLGVSLGGGAGWATDVTDPGVAHVPLVVRADLAWSPRPGMDAAVLGRFQPQEPVAALVMPAVRWYPGHGRLYLAGGVPLGRIAHTVPDTETGRASVAGLGGLGLGTGAAVGLGGGLALFGEVLVMALYPDFTVHGDACVGVRIGL